MIYRIMYGEQDGCRSAIFVEAYDIVFAAEYARNHVDSDILEIKAYKTAPRSFMGERVRLETIIKA